MPVAVIKQLNQTADISLYLQQKMLKGKCLHKDQEKDGMFSHRANANIG